MCYGDQSKQTFTEYDGFEQDYSVLINSFTIEMRMSSTYAAIWEEVEFRVVSYLILNAFANTK
jgi:hypothetical protein